jgi:hypothetical protein
MNDKQEIEDEYQVELINWTETDMDLKVNFDDGSRISRNNRNQNYAELNVKNKFFFIS